ncbi:MAG: GDP-mannose 4,6-dehydratase [Candidatus Gracilibacteria bacterium]|nr:GDP-mannose 4,6-dehydratase [Candidatus Gracilibacteria bacterium]
MKALITGSTGFVGPYLKKELESHGYEVFGLDRNNPEKLESVFCGDICDVDFVESVVKQVMPDEIYHLAGFSSVKKSFDEPELTMKINVGGTKNLLEAVRKFCPESKVLIVSSADVYGKPNKIPINEYQDLVETSPYSISRIAQEKLIDEFKDLFIVVSRSFNHTGPGQPEIFVLPDFVKQVVEIEKGIKDSIIFTGNLDVVRDFSDVRDVVKAYYLLLQKGKKGEVYNVGSGKGYNLAELLNKIIDLSGIKIEVKQDPSKMRPIEIVELVADISKIVNDTRWEPDYSIDRTIEDLLNYWRLKI